MNNILIIILCIIILLCINFDKNNNIEYFEDEQSSFSDKPADLQTNSCTTAFTSFNTKLNSVKEKIEDYLDVEYENLKTNYNYWVDSNSIDYSVTEPETICNNNIKRKIFYEKQKSELENFLAIATKIREDLDVYIGASELLNTDNTSPGASPGAIFNTINTYSTKIKTIWNDIQTKHVDYANKYKLIDKEIADTTKLIDTALDELGYITTENIDFQTLTTKKESTKNNIKKSEDNIRFYKPENQLNKDDFMYEKVNNLCLASGVISDDDGGGSGGYCDKSQYGCKYTCSLFDNEGACKDKKGSNSINYNTITNILGETVKIHSHIHTHNNMDKEALDSAHPH